MPFRALQTELLAKYLGSDNDGIMAHPSAIAVHGPRGTGKTTTVRNFLTSQPSLTFSWVQCEQCLTTRVLLQRALRKIFDATQCASAEDANCENINVFLSIIRENFMLSQKNQQHVLVLDRLDELPDYRATTDLFACLSRIPELIGGDSNFCVIFIYSTAESRGLLTNLAVPRVWFPRFSAEEALQILLASMRDICVENTTLHDSFRVEFIELVMKALGPRAGSDVASLKRTARKIWPEFSEGVSKEDSIARIYIQKAHLFSPDQLVDRLGDRSTGGGVGARALEVTPLSCYLLCAAYLASYNHPRYDMPCFSLAKTMRSRRREVKPKKSLVIPERSLAPPAFEIERLMAIYHAIHPMSYEFQPSVSTGREWATLEAQNLVVKTANDPLSSRTKWKINVPWSYVQRVAEQIEFNIEDYLVEA